MDQQYKDSGQKTAASEAFANALASKKGQDKNEKEAEKGEVEQKREL